MKNARSKIKPIKKLEKIETTYCFGCKDYTDNFKPQEIKMKNKVLRETVLFVDLINQDFSNKNTTTKNNSTFLQTDVIK